MDRARFSAVGHAGMRFWNPVRDSDMEALAARLPLPPGALVLDAGCGRGELLVLLATRRGATCVGVDASPFAAAAAREAVEGSGASGRVTIREESFDPGKFPPAAFDLAVCVGSSQVVGTTAAALRTLRDLVRPGGLVLLGEGYWKRDPDPGYLEFLAAERDDYRDHAGTGRLGPEAGLERLESSVASPEDWDRYEDAYAANVESFVASHPGDPDADAMLARIRPWRAGYLRWGRDTLGFGLYLFRRPA